MRLGAPSVAQGRVIVDAITEEPPLHAPPRLANFLHQALRAWTQVEVHAGFAAPRGLRDRRPDERDRRGRKSCQTRNLTLRLCLFVRRVVAWGALIAALLIAQHSSVCQGLLACDPPTCVGGSDRGVTLPHGRWVHDQGA